MGFEPMHIGTTIRGLDHLTTGAIFPTNSSIANKDLNASKNISINANKKEVLYEHLFFIKQLLLVDSLEHISDTTSC